MIHVPEFRNGINYATSIMAIITTSFALFNLAVDVFSIGVSPILTPIVQLYSQFVEFFFGWVTTHFNAILPDWNHHFMMFYVLCYSLISQIDKRYSHPIMRILTVLMAFILLAIPYVRWIAVLIVGTILTWSALPFFKVSDDHIPFQKAGSHILGMFICAGLLLLLNNYY